MEEDIEIIKCANEYASEKSPKSKKEHKHLVDAYIVGAEEMQKRLNRQISELTEALDASHIFCEGVSDLMAEKAWGWFCTNLDKFTKEIRLEDAIKLYSQYNQAMKGE